MGDTVTIPRLRALAAAVALLALLAAGCGTSDDEGGDATTTTTADEGTTETTAATTEGDDETTTTGEPGQDAAASWEATAAEHRGQNGETFEYECSPDGVENTIWGTEVYTDDSSVCTAAVHVGLITFAEGGTVTIEISEGQELYMGSSGNGLLSSDYGAFEGSFQFPDAPPDSGDFEIGQESWARTATTFGGVVGDTFSVPCSANGLPGSVWGTGTYTADSSVCSAAVHAGLITVAEGGMVTYDIVAGMESYEGTEANGITSQSYGAYDTSFTFPTEQGSDGG